MKKLRKVFVGIVLTILFLPVMVNATSVDYDTANNTEIKVINEIVELEVDAQYDVSDNIDILFDEDVDQTLFPVEYKVKYSSNQIFSANGSKIMALEQGLGHVSVEVSISGAKKYAYFDVMVKAKEIDDYAHVNIPYYNRSVVENDEFQIEYEVIRPEGSSASEDVVWQVEKGKELATVSDTGFVHISKGSGTVTISATSSTGDVTEISFEVMKSVELSFGLHQEVIHSKSVEVNQRYDVDSLLRIRSWASEYKLVWSSSDKNIVSVDQNGVIETKKIGKANITVSAVQNNEVISTSTIEIIVTGYKSTLIISANGVEDSLGYERMPASSTLQLVARVTSNNPDKSVKWAIVEPLEGLTISSTGLLTSANGTKGSALVKATNADGVSTYIRIYVDPMETVLYDAFDYYNIITGADKDFGALLIDYSYLGYHYEFSSSDEDTAIVDEYGIVSTLSDGLVTIKYKLYDENNTLIAEGVFKLNIGTEFKNDDVSIVSFLDTDTFNGLLLEVGGTIKINVLTNTDETYYKFINETPEIVEVDKEGYITGLSKGIAKIQIKVYNGDEEIIGYNNRYVQVYVGYADQFLDFNIPSEVNLQLGEEYKLDFNKNVDDDSIAYTMYIMNPDILSYDKDTKKIEANAIGSTYIEMGAYPARYPEPLYYKIKSDFYNRIMYTDGCFYAAKFNVYQKIKSTINNIVNPTPSTGSVIGTTYKEYYDYNYVETNNLKENTTEDEKTMTTNTLDSSDNKKDKNKKKEVKVEDDDDDEEEKTKSKAPIIILIIVVAGGLIFGVYKAKDMLE